MEIVAGVLFVALLELTISPSSFVVVRRLIEIASVPSSSAARLLDPECEEEDALMFLSMASCIFLRRLAFAAFFSSSVGVFMGGLTGFVDTRVLSFSLSSFHCRGMLRMLDTGGERVDDMLEEFCVVVRIAECVVWKKRERGRRRRKERLGSANAEIPAQIHSTELD